MTSEVMPELFASVPDQDGRFGRFGGKFVARLHWLISVLISEVETSDIVKFVEL